MHSRIEFEFTTKTRSPSVSRSESTPMRILVLGDFSAYNINVTEKERSTISKRNLKPVDLDCLDQVLGQTAPELALSLGTNLTAHVSFAEMDDFHPDSLFLRLPLFNELRDLRQRLHNEETYREAATLLKTMLSLKAPAVPMSEGVTPVIDTKATESDTATLDRLLGRPTDSTVQAEKTARSAIDKLLEKAMKGHIVPESDAAQQVYFDAIDQALGDLMNQILYHPDFQALESLWRSVEFLISRLELDEDLQLVLLDVSKDELMQDLRQSDFKLKQSELYRLLIEQGVAVPGTEPWSLMVGLYCFDNSEDDTRLLAALGTVGAHAGGPFLAQANTTLLGCNSLVNSSNPHDWNADDEEGQKRWDTLRASESAKWIGLALPRMLLRLPYGTDTDEIDSFVFQEVTDASDHQRFLWGNPAVGCAVLIGQAFTERGWLMAPGDILNLGELPAYSFLADDEHKILPCAEVYLAETAVDKILEQGLIPMMSLHNSDRIQLLRFQSIASPACALAGIWA